MQLKLGCFAMKQYTQNNYITITSSCIGNLIAVVPNLQNNHDLK